MTVDELEAIEPNLDGADLRVGIVQSRYNEAHARAVLVACVGELLRLGVGGTDIVLASVPGALEIPFALRQMAESGEFDALVAIGCVLRGETYHFEIVASESARGISEVALAANLPIANAVLTCDTDAQAAARSAEKGSEAARVAVEMANLALELASDEQEDDDEQ